MKKRRYKSISVNDDQVAALVSAASGQRVSVGVDIAKTRQFAAFMTEDSQVRAIVRWEHPVESRTFIDLLKRIRDKGGTVEVAMEPSSTYGDAIRSGLLQAGFPVYRVNPKRSHDAAEVFDGVPSLHDAKSAWLIAKLHLERASESWPIPSEHERGLKAALKVLGIFEKQFRENRNRMEGLCARHWPELPRALELGSATLLELLMEFGSAKEAVRRSEEARELMNKIGGRFLSPETVDQVIEDARTSFGVDPTEEERSTIRQIAQETRRCQQAARKAKRRVEKLTEHDGAAQRMRAAIGKTTAAVLVAAAGDPAHYHCASAYRKALGLNLKENSSGEAKIGGLHITKRGSGLARLYLYMAALRLLQRDPIVRAWYDKKVKRQGGIAKKKAVVSVMRKLAIGLFHVAKGQDFDSAMLFDVSRLDLKRDTAQASCA